MAERWYETAYRRCVIDMHIADWDERFLSEFDPKTYVDMLVLSQVRSAVVYAHSHVGLCYFPSKVGPMHKGLKGRNIFGEVIDLCHQNGINVVVYYSVIFDTWAYRNNPDWRIISANGEEAAKQSRYGICCPNSPYRDYAVAIAEEICENFDIEGIRFDMTFWPQVCYCPHCQRRFAEEVGGELPKIIHWENPHWVRFQRKREEWLAEFAELLTKRVKRIKPYISVEHQASTYILNWRFGVTEKLARQNDFLQGDFYGDALQGSFARKLFHNLSENLPFGFETSFCVNIVNHTAKKPKELLEAKAFASLADGGAFVFIDAIDPVGSLNPRVYECMREILNKTKKYEPYLGGKLCQDVAVYLSTESKFDPADNGKAVDDPNLSTAMPHVEAALNACQSLIEHHIPFGVITKKNLTDLSRHQVLVLPNILMVDEEEVEAIRSYVRSGGNLYASKYTSLITKDGTRRDDFLLADVFGVSFVGETRETYTYIAPVKATVDLFSGYTERYPLAFNSSQMILNAKPGVEILGRMVLPYTDPAEWERFASIHSNPPGIHTDRPAIVRNRFGKGQAIYTTVDLENSRIYSSIFINLIRLLSNSFSFEADAPKPVEITAFHQGERKRFIISLVNFQKDLPNIPVQGIRVRVRMEERKVKRLVLLPEEKELPYRKRGDFVEFCAPQLETFLMFALDYDQ
jgi:hypothetical protein